MILVSACLVGENCKYSGGNNLCPAVVSYLEGKDYVTFCPEQAGGLPTPRLPSEIWEGRVLSQEGTDVTAQFKAGAAAALGVCREKGVTLAILKQSSPSCGTETVYDGTFSGTKRPGRGVTAALLADNGIPVLGENNFS